MKENILVRRPGDLTVSWAQKIVNIHSNAIKVSRIDIVSIDIGTTTRIRLNIEHNGPETLPRRWFVKLPSRAWRARVITSLSRLLHIEVRFYKEIAPSVPVTRPVILAAQSKFGRGTTLVLMDVTELGARPGCSSDALTVAQAALVIKQLADFHAHFWNTSRDPKYRWLAGPVRRLEDNLGSALAAPLMKRGLQRAGSLIPGSLHAPAMHYARHRRLAMRSLSDGPQTLVHHDCHPGNLFWTLSRPGFLDWQLVRIGEGISDIAYFLATALDPETRRLHEASFIASYFHILEDNGVAGIDFKNLLLRYRAHLVYPLEAMLMTLAIGGMMDSESNLELIRRTAAAVEDHDAFSVLPI
ncbi:phosphotransferase family protein [Candidatus Methylobacter favarea]|nr:phosphotransferase [Candidatus Methylobacter favarea]